MAERRAGREFRNTYEEARRAAAYDELELGGTYHLVFRDLPGLLSECVTGRQAVDFARIVTTTYSDNRPVDDILWTDEDYRAVFGEAGLEVERVERPLGTGDDSIPWVSETKVAPWAIYILKPVG